MIQLAIVIADGFDIGSLGAISAFEAANHVFDQRRYAVSLLSEQGGEIRADSGLAVMAAPLTDAAFDTILIAGGDDSPTGEGVVDFLHRGRRTARRFGSLHRGVFALGQAGLLDGRRATTHWSLVDNLRECFPDTQVEDDSLFVIDGSIWTSAGMTASVDFALAMIENDCGAEVAMAVARQQVLSRRRHPRDSQQSPTLEIAPRSDRVQRALAYARANLGAPLKVEELADAARLSPRQFSRVFSAETGCSPARAVERLRVEAAHLLVVQGRVALNTIARDAGFDDPERMRRAFVRTLGKCPHAIRRSAEIRVSV